MRRAARKIRIKHPLEVADKLFLAEQQIHAENKAHRNDKNAVRNGGRHHDDRIHQAACQLGGLCNQGRPVDGEGVDLLLRDVELREQPRRLAREAFNINRGVIHQNHQRGDKLRHHINNDGRQNQNQREKRQKDAHAPAALLPKPAAAPVEKGKHPLLVKLEQHIDHKGNGNAHDERIGDTDKMPDPAADLLEIKKGKDKHDGIGDVKQYFLGELQVANPVTPIHRGSSLPVHSFRCGGAAFFIIAREDRPVKPERQNFPGCRLYCNRALRRYAESARDKNS